MVNHSCGLPVVLTQNHDKSGKICSWFWSDLSWFDQFDRFGPKMSPKWSISRKSFGFSYWFDRFGPKMSQKKSIKMDHFYVKSLQIFHFWHLLTATCSPYDASRRWKTIIAFVQNIDSQMFLIHSFKNIIILIDENVSVIY